MKISILHLFGILFLFFLLFDTVIIVAQNKNSDYITISGIIKNMKSKRPISGVNISVSGTYISTITNNDGFFKLKTKRDYNVNLINVSYLGFENKTVNITKDSMRGLEIFLRPHNKHLNKIAIITLNPASIVMEALKNVSVYYNDKDCILTGFYRETTQKKNEYINVTEAIVDIHKISLIQSPSNDRIRLIKGRRLLDSNINDNLIVKLKGGLYLSVMADIVNNHNAIFSPEMMGYYKFRMLQTVLINNKEQYVIDFEPKFKSSQALYHGKIYIEKEHITISRIEFSLIMDNKELATRKILCEKAKALDFKPQEMSFLVSYKYDDGLVYLNYIKNVTRFKCNLEHKNFPTGYKVVSEFVITDFNKSNAISIPYSELSDNKDIFYNKLEVNSDCDFWKDYNIIEQSESLKRAVDKSKK